MSTREPARSARSWANVAWLTGTTLLIGFISYSSQIFVIWPWYGREWSWELVKLLVPFNACVAMVWWNYRLCVVTPPGSVPLGWRPNLHSGEHVEVKANAAPRYCKSCNHYKPPRAHHCRHCKNCVLRLDHHCPWIANCVGFHNHGHFIRFLLWVDIATSFHLLMMVGKVMSIVRDPYPGLSELMFIIFNFAACIPVWMSVGFFSLYHLYLISGNTTTIERWEKDKVATLVRRGKIQEIEYPYNISFMTNMRAVLGPNWYTWLAPQRMVGDGLSFPVNDAGISAPPPVRRGGAERRARRARTRARPAQWQLLRAALELVECEQQWGCAAGEAEGAPEDASAAGREHGLDAGALWPPREPDYYRSQPALNGSPFVYGDGFNPALRPSSSRPRNAYVPPWETALNSDGEEGSERSGSSPEPYLSDYDEEAPVAYSSARVRRGSEGWEVRPAGWAGGSSGEAWAAQAAQQAAWDQERLGRPPWEQPGRYRTYIPDDTEEDVYR